MKYICSVYDKCLEINPDDAMAACSYAGLMMEKGEYQKAEILFKKALEKQDIPNAYTAWRSFSMWPVIWRPREACWRRFNQEPAY